MKHDYEITHPQVDCLVNLARESGAPGARVTGAGFGGCVLILCPSGKIDELRQFLSERFYDSTDMPVFEVSPSSSALVRSL